MRMPGFTAEASLRQATTGYWAEAVSLEAGRVLPQGLFVNLHGDLIYCFDEGGFSGCFTIVLHHGAITALLAAPPSLNAGILTEEFTA